MEAASKLRRLCEAYIRQTIPTHKFDLPDFVDYMEPIFARFGYRGKDLSDKESILVIRLDDIGDCVMTSGFLRELRKNRPSAHIALVVKPLVRPLMEHCPYVDEVFGFASGPGMALQDILRSAFSFCYRHLWERHYDVCFCPQWDIDYSWTPLLGFISGARERIGYSEKAHLEKGKLNHGYDLLLSRALTSPSDVVHEVSRAFYLLQDFGMQVEEGRTELWFDSQDELVAHRLLVNFKEGHLLAVVALGASQARKKYPVEQYVEALRQIAKGKVRFVLLGGSDVDLEGSYFVRNMPKGAVLNLIGQTYLRVTAAVVSKADLYIGNDTGIAHMAAACGVPVIEIMAEAEDKRDDPPVYSAYERFFPWNTPAIVLRPNHALPPCNETAVLGGCCTMMPHCIRGVSPEEIVEAYAVMGEYLRGERGMAQRGGRAGALSRLR